MLGGRRGEEAGDNSVSEEQTFETMAGALRFMEEHVDRPVDRREADLGRGLRLVAAPYRLLDGTFTNSYDVSWSDADLPASGRLAPRPVDMPYSSGGAAPQVVSTAAFFVLADRAAALPTQASLNLALDEAGLRSLPVVDREAVVCRDGRLSMVHLQARGLLSLNGRSLSWEGSGTGRGAQAYVYGNGNAVIERIPDPRRGSIRVLCEASRRTPPAGRGSGLVDVGFAAAGPSSFVSREVSAAGSVDIFAHDLVVRFDARDVPGTGEPLRLEVETVGSLRGDQLPEFAVTVGPSFQTPDFAAHPINGDPALGPDAPFADDHKVRIALYRDLDGRTHLRLFDGRPGSRAFTGPSPSEARAIIGAESGYDWGCFLDGGQTAKMWVVEDGRLTSYGNRHYLRWPASDSDPFVWVPDAGRPVPSWITLGPERGVDAANQQTAMDVRSVASQSFPRPITEASSQARAARPGAGPGAGPTPPVRRPPQVTPGTRRGPSIR